MAVSEKCSRVESNGDGWVTKTARGVSRLERDERRRRTPPRILKTIEGLREEDDRHQASPTDLEVRRRSRSPGSRMFSESWFQNVLGSSPVPERSQGPCSEASRHFENVPELLASSFSRPCFFGHFHRRW